MVRPGLTGWAQIKAPYASTLRGVDREAQVRPLLHQESVAVPGHLDPALHGAGSCSWDEVPDDRADARRAALPEAPVDLLRHAARPRAGLRILYLCHRVPYPPDKGEKIRAFHQIQALARRHRVHLLTLADGRAARPGAAWRRSASGSRSSRSTARRATCARRSGRCGRGRSRLSFFESEELAARRARAGPAASGSTSPSSTARRWRPTPSCSPDVPAVLDMVDVDSAKWAQYARFAPLPLRPVYALEARRLRRYEASLAGRFQRIFLATGNETRLYKANAPAARAATVLNGRGRRLLPAARPAQGGHSRRWSSPARWTTSPTSTASSTSPARSSRACAQRYPELELLIVGRAPVPAVRDLGELPGVQVTGAVGDVRPFLARAWMFVAPLRIAQGVQNKVLEAMASNVPVVCSERVLAGLADGGFRSGRDLLAAASDEEMEQRRRDADRRRRARGAPGRVRPPAAARHLPLGAQPGPLRGAGRDRRRGRRRGSSPPPPAGGRGRDGPRPTEAPGGRARA